MVTRFEAETYSNYEEEQRRKPGRPTGAHNKYSDGLRTFDLEISLSEIEYNFVKAQGSGYLAKLIRQEMDLYNRNV